MDDPEPGPPIGQKVDQTPLLQIGSNRHSRQQDHAQPSNRAFVQHIEIIRHKARPMSNRIRVREPPLEETDLVMRKLDESVHRLVAAPDLMARFATPSGPADLADWPSLDFGPIRRVRARG